MKITNVYNLPDPIVKRLEADVYEPDPNRIGVTSLIDSPLIRHLRIQHWDELEEDASERLWALLGSAVHYLFDNKPFTANRLTEERLELKHPSGLTIVGYNDDYADGVLTDYKVTSVWSYIFGKTSWDKQLNVLAYLLEQNGFAVKKAQICLLLRDWQLRRAETESDYPKQPIAIVDIPLWSTDQRRAYVDERIRMHQAVPVPECTAEDKWERPTTYAVKKKGHKRALRVFDKFEDAQEFLKTSGDIIETRKGEMVRCQSYCPVRQFCPFCEYVEKSDEAEENQRTIPRNGRPEVDYERFDVPINRKRG